MTPNEKKYRDTICNMLGIPPESTRDELREARGAIIAIAMVAGPDKAALDSTLAAVDLLMETAVSDG